MDYGFSLKYIKVLMYAFRVQYQLVSKRFNIHDIKDLGCFWSSLHHVLVLTHIPLQRISAVHFIEGRFHISGFY